MFSLKSKFKINQNSPKKRKGDIGEMKLEKSIEKVKIEIKKKS